MNVYVIDAGPYEYTDRIAEWGGPRYEDSSRTIISAESRGQAKAKFFEDRDIRRAFDWTSPMRIRLLARDIEDGDLNTNALWIHASAVLDGLDEAHEWEWWQFGECDAA